MAELDGGRLVGVGIGGVGVGWGGTGAAVCIPAGSWGE